MNGNSHPWSSDPEGQAAIRTAEPDRGPTLAHHEVPAMVEKLGAALVATASSLAKAYHEMAEALYRVNDRVARLEIHFADASKMVPPAPVQITQGDELATVRDGGGRPMPKGPPPGLVTPPTTKAATVENANADPLRTERVTLEITHKWVVPAAEGAVYAIKDVFRYAGESVRVVWGGDEERPNDLGMLCTASELADRCTELARRLVCQGDDVTRLTDEREAAKAECERLRKEWRIAQDHATRAVARRDASLDDADGLRARVAELEAAAAANAGGEVNHQGSLDSSLQPPRGWLTPDERQVLTEVADEAEQSPSKEKWAHVASCVRALLARETPPKVQLPPEIAGVVYDAVSVRNAIRAAGYKVTS